MPPVAVPNTSPPDSFWRVRQAIDERSGGGEEGQSDAEAITGMRSPNGILLFLLVLTAVLLFLFIVGGVVGLRRIAGVPTIRLSRTGQRPELSLHRGVLWHLFNSHIWSTGQDAAAAIKKELQLLLPGINVFLDARPQNHCAARSGTAPKTHRVRTGGRLRRYWGARDVHPPVAAHPLLPQPRVPQVRELSPRGLRGPRPRRAPIPLALALTGAVG